MREVFRQELEEVQNRLVEIAELVLESIEKATKAFKSSDVALADTVIENDNRIDELTAQIDELAIDIMARQQPVARDLRIVVSALRISSSLERMGDMAEHIAQLSRFRFPEKVVPKVLRPTFNKLAEQDVKIARKVVELLRTQDISIAEAIRTEDDVVDALHVSIFEHLLSVNWEGDTEATVDAVLASRYHERFADHAVSIAKKMFYLATGEWQVAKDEPFDEQVGA